jgi:signal transduction histidine kinase
MKVRPIAIIILIVLLPMILLSWAAIRLDRSERLAGDEQYRELVKGRLKDVSQAVRKTFDAQARKMLEIFPVDERDVDGMREITRNEPLVTQLFVLNARGELQYPNPTQILNSSERNFLLSASRMFTTQALLDVVNQRQNPETLTRTTDRVPMKLNDSGSSSEFQTSQSFSGERLAELQGWFVWYWDQGLHLIYWQRRSNGNIVGIALERSRWIAELIAELPETEGNVAEETHFRLVSDLSETIYQWGNYIPAAQSLPIAEVPAAEPLQAWRLQAYLPATIVGQDSRSRLISLVALLGAIGMGLGSMAWVLYQDYRKSVVEAMQQVSFVNQVSHELKTPLTNIQLYAELLQRDLASIENEAADLAQARVEVVVAETQRLGRLINNVLSHARQRKGTLQPMMRVLVPDDVIKATLQRFEPSLNASDFHVELKLSASHPTCFDPDFLEQILGNLISNAEKYASQGRWLQIESFQGKEQFGFVVSDRGPGIDQARQNKVFMPFNRQSSQLSSVSGTGIGLSIARELSRIHGGDLTLDSTKSGCRFRVVLNGGKS